MLFNVQVSHGQSIEKIKLKTFYRYDHLDVIIDAIGKETDIRFIYEQEHLHRYKMSVDLLGYDSGAVAADEVHPV